MLLDKMSAPTISTLPNTTTIMATTGLTPTSPMSPNVTDANATTLMTTMDWTTAADTNRSDCLQGMTLIRDHLGMCVETTTQMFAFSIAVVAVAMWIIAHFFLLKSRRNDPDCSCGRLSLILVCGLGSVCNLIGATLSDQLGTQVLTACYLTFSDLVLLIQWLHWWNRNRKLNKQGLSFYVASDGWKSPGKTREENTLNGGGELALCLFVPWLMTACYWPARFTFASLLWQPSYADHAHATRHGRQLLMVSESSTDNFGYAMGFCALFLYSLCRIPTIINIVRHKTNCTESLLYHGFVIVANTCYFISIVSYNTDSFFLLNALPWLLISLALIAHSSIIILLVLRNRGVGPGNGPVGRRRADGTYLLYPSEESLTSDLERSGSLRFNDDASSAKLPSIQEEPHLEVAEQTQTMATPEEEEEEEEDEHDDDYDAETASIHSRASDFIFDDDEDVYVRNDEASRKSPGKKGAQNFDDDGLEWDFDDFRPRYTDSDDQLDDVGALSGSPGRHHTLGVPHDHGNVGEDDWDEERVLSEIERELKLGDDIDGDTISMEYDTADDEEHFENMQYSYLPHS